MIKHLTDRPCAVCEFHKENGCSKWSCVFEQEPKIGHWIDCKCDKCGYVVQPWNTTSFCPNCGADMRGEE